MTILVTALEASANVHLKELLLALREQNTPFKLVGIYDEELCKSMGVDAPLLSSHEFGVMGFLEVLPLIMKAKRAINELSLIKADLFLAIDSPAFNIPLGKRLSKTQPNMRKIYYILPQVWAWKAKRAAILREHFDILASIWPFEQRFHDSCLYVGAPLLDELGKPKPTPAQFLQALNEENKAQNKDDLDANLGEQTPKAFTQKKKISCDLIKNKDDFCAKTNDALIHPKAPKIKTLCFMPGSRKAEISKLMPVFRSFIKDKSYKLILCIPVFFKDKIAEIYGDVSAFSLSFSANEALRCADFAFICSGTATLEATLLNTPFILCFKARAFDVMIARFVAKVSFIGLANIIMEFEGKQSIHPELIQEDLNVQSLNKSFRDYDYLSFYKGSAFIREYLSHGSCQKLATIIKNIKGFSCKKPQ